MDGPAYSVAARAAPRVYQDEGGQGEGSYYY